MLHRAFEGDFGPIAQGIYTIRHLGAQQLSFGLHFSVMCAEANPDLDPTVVARESEGTFLGDYRVQQLKQACREWPRGKMPAGFDHPVRWDAPTLILSGSLDPNTPPRFGEIATLVILHSFDAEITGWLRVGYSYLPVGLDRAEQARPLRIKNAFRPSTQHVAPSTQHLAPST